MSAMHAAVEPSIPRSTVMHQREGAAKLNDPASRKLRARILDAVRVFREAVEHESKEKLRERHLAAKQVAGGIQRPPLIRRLGKLKHYFAEGRKIDPSRIEPMLAEVTPRSLEDHLFKLVRTSWSMPYSKGYGRRLRFVVMDAHHETVIGIIGLQSAPADLACRDRLVGESPDKLRWVNATMDAFTLGAMAPYAELLGGKLVAGLVASDEVRIAYWRKYGGARSVMMKQRTMQPLLAVTTTSAFGRSSIYNRLKFEGRSIAEPIGYTKGFGTLHLESVYPEIEAWLKIHDRFVPPGYGNGPKVRWQNIQNTITLLGLPHSLLAHGLEREAFLFRHVSNFERACKQEEVPIPIAMPASTWAEYWKDRWGLPRAKRTSKWKWIAGSTVIESCLRQA